MFKKIKLIIEAVVKFKNVVKEYEEVKKEKAPIYLHRRFLHSIIVFASIVFLYFSGVSITEADINQITDNIFNVFASITALWGIIGTLIGQIDRNKK